MSDTAKNIRITNISLRNFRIHKELSITTKSNNVIIVGKNGSGKTSILESISLMSPGKGFLCDTLSDIVHTNSDNMKESECNANMETDSDFNISMNIVKNFNKYDKKILINDKKISKQTDLFNWCHIVWFTYSLQYSVIHSTSERRKFFDRITFYLFNNHAHLINTYDKLIHERLKLLKNGACDKKILDAIEWQISTCSIPILKNRRNMVESVNNNINRDSFESLNLAALLQINHNVEFNGDEEKAITFIQETFRKNRDLDRMSERTNAGLHKCNFIITGKDSNNIENLSSGEQKMAMISILLSISAAISEIYNRNPIILLDEVFSFLDKSNIKIANSLLSSVSSQVWMANASLDIELPSDIEVINI